MSLSNDEIDLRPYIFAVIRYWWMILLVTALFAVTVLIYSLQQPRQYQATAEVLLSRNRTRLALTDQFPNTSEPSDPTMRRDAFVSIIQSDNLLQQVINQLEMDQPPTLGKLQSQIKVTNRSDLLLLSVTAQTPEEAAMIANTWARQATKTINLAYLEEQPLPEIQAQLSTAMIDYQNAQTALEEFLKDSSITYLQNKVSETRSLLQNLSSDRTWQVSYYTLRKQSMLDLVTQAEALKRQMEAGNISQVAKIGDSLAVLFTRATAFGIQPVTIEKNAYRPSQDSQSGSLTNGNGLGLLTDSLQTSSNDRLQVNLQATDITVLAESPEIYIRELDNIIQAAQAEQAQASEKLTLLSQDVLEEGAGDLPDQINVQLALLEAQLENRIARSRELTSQRDFTWQAYQALAAKEIELKNGIQTENYANLVNPAVAPIKPAPRGTASRVILAGVIGAALATMFIVVRFWWQSFKLNQNPLTTIPTADASD